MKRIELPFGKTEIELQLSDDIDILSMGTPVAIEDPQGAIKAALDESIASPGLDEVIAARMAGKTDPTAVIVISDNTRPVPYTGENGILWPVVERLLAKGVSANKITVLVATGTHRGLTDAEIESMIDRRVHEAGVRILNHECKDREGLVHLGRTKRGGEVYINRLYMESDIRILTGLVESHFMAGASGGRKSICPGLVGEKSTFVFHGAEIMSDPNSTDLKLEGNPCHEESFEVAQAAGTDYIVNVTLDHQFNLTGVFAGELKAAHEAAVEHLKSYTAVPYSGEYDLVVTHAGFVGINHYQAAKVGTVAARIVKPGGHVMIVADNTDTDSVGSLAYRTVLQLLTLNGAEAVERMLKSPDWTFIPEQWQVQMWCRLFRKIPIDHLYYYSPQFTDHEYGLTAGSKLSQLAGVEETGDPKELIPAMINRGIEELRRRSDGPLRIAYLKDGPYGIPL